MPSFGNFVLVKVGDASRVYQELLKRGVIVRPVGNYGLPEWLRITVGLPEENARFVEALTAALRMRLALIGVGLIGGSFARALRAAGKVDAIVGFDSQPDALRRAIDLGVIDQSADSAARAVEQADLGDDRNAGRIDQRRLACHCPASGSGRQSSPMSAAQRRA